jgi:hypothetical protein
VLFKYNTLGVLGYLGIRHFSGVFRSPFGVFCIADWGMNQRFQQGFVYGGRGHAHNGSREEGATPYPKAVLNAL